MNNLSDYARRKDALHDQLAGLLRPETDHERSMLAWLRDSVSLDGLAAFAEMAERTFQLGFHAGTAHARADLSQLERDQEIGEQRRKGEQR